MTKIVCPLSGRCVEEDTVFCCVTVGLFDSPVFVAVVAGLHLRAVPDEPSLSDPVGQTDPKILLPRWIDGIQELEDVVRLK